MSLRAISIVLAVVAALAGCGLKGPLYLPEKSKEVVLRPAPAAEPGSPSGTAPGPALESPPAPGEASDAPSPPQVPEDSQVRPPGSGRG